MPVKLIPFNLEHITNDYLNWLNDPVLLKYSRQSQKKHTYESCVTYQSSFANTSNYFWSVQDEKSGQVGTVTCYVDLQSQVADIGIMIGKPGRGTGKEAWGEALKFCFEQLSLRKVTAGTLAEHQAMIKIFEHWGMSQEGLLRQQERLNGQIFDVVRYGILKEEFELFKSGKPAHDNNRTG